MLRDTNGTVHVRFSTPQEIFEAAGKYPAGGERTIKPPVIPEYEFDERGDGEYDIVVVPEPERDENGKKEPLTPFDLQQYRDGAPNVPLPTLLDDTFHGDDTRSPPTDETVRDGIQDMFRVN